ncbi:RNA polymerase sigma factor [Burkholderia sp. Ac-20353]|uniref:RNA polymerase sigma factor n=1 Tax=Burkholderia sp. Ac-20353 TaxID=2703894 RepID=UPI001F11E74B|nr:RNA polymerase sigma factor [Burkholderia sp. Ac-20353]
MRSLLMNLLVSRYATLRKRLEFFLGSRDKAADALQETWVRLETLPKVGTVSNADAYLLRMAVNISVDQHRKEHRETPLEEAQIDALFEAEDELADPARILEGRRKVDALIEIVEGLTPRRQEILLAARVDGLLNTEIAQRMGISLRLVEKELSEALKHCNHRLLGMSTSGSTKGRRKF